jgi:hypothetical protein
MCSHCYSRTRLERKDIKESCICLPVSVWAESPTPTKGPPRTRAAPKNQPSEASGITHYVSSLRARARGVGAAAAGCRPNEGLRRTNTPTPSNLPHSGYQPYPATDTVRFTLRDFTGTFVRQSKKWEHTTTTSGASVPRAAT